MRKFSQRAPQLTAATIERHVGVLPTKPAQAAICSQTPFSTGRTHWPSINFIARGTFGSEAVTNGDYWLFRKG